MNRAENVVRYYELCNRLKYLIRTGWKAWNVNSDRLESVAEHIYGVQMLAIAMKSEYQEDVDIMKVVMMLAVHELEEIIIGDLTLFQISNEEKEKIGHKAIEEILNGLMEKDKIKALIIEFDERKTNEAKFAYQCDKLECDLQSKVYGELGCVDVENQPGNRCMENPKVKMLLDSGLSWAQMWMTFGQERYNYDANFMEVSNYAMTHDILRK